MKKLITIILALVLVTGIAVSLAACSGTKEANEIEMPAYDSSYASMTVPADFKIGLICLHDESSTYDLNFINAAKAAVRALGMSDDQLVIKTGIAEEGTACYETAKDLINNSKCKVIFADSFGHESSMIKAAKEFPNVEFCHATGTDAHTENLSNYHNAFANIYQGRYLAGVAAGMKLNEMIKDGKITADKAVMGYVGAYPYEEVKSGYTSFYLGAKSVCPSVTMKVQFTGSWYDVTAEKSAAENLIKQGCVLISQHADSMGAPSACEKKGVPNVSYNGSTISACPKTFIVSSRINWEPYFKLIIARTVNGLAIPTDYVGTIQDGSVVLTGINGDVAAEGTLKKIIEVRAALVKGTIKVFDLKNFTVNGQALSHDTKANVDSDPNFEAETNVISYDGINNIWYFAESAMRSAPYFGIDIDGITLLN